MSGVAAAAGGDGGGGAPPTGAGAGAPGGGAMNDNNNGGNSASPSSGGPFSGYNLLLLFPLLALSLYYVRYVLVPVLHDASMRYCYVHVPVPNIHDAHSMLLDMLRSPYTAYAMIIALTFWIKICRLMTIFPTIQKPDRSFSVVGFAAALKPHAFDGSNYKRWKALHYSG
uniref:Retrotransposon protein, putative, Ty1-copia subclass n=1 Tax=Oryza sativa subsp. japonica TaxID=39947 RepID=Q2QUS3_ORYSJ|nr:retrotransposon protein, putative, Ty1-copia subclass [Oryza sativa Japonica Group]